MRSISSLHNQLIKELGRLASKRSEREARQLTILDGVSLVLDYLKRGGQAQTILLDKAQTKQPAFQEIMALSPPECHFSLPAALLQKISTVKQSPGVIAIVKTKSHSLAELQVSNSPVLILDRIQDPGNLGTILRDCLAFGMQDVCLTNASVEAFAPKVVRASRGACFELNIYQKMPLPETLSHLRALNYQIIATSPHAKVCLRQAKPLPKATAWLFGNEASGLEEVILQNVDQTIKIPQSSDLESLNLATAVAICLYEAYSASKFL